MTKLLTESFSAETISTEIFVVIYADNFEQYQKVQKTFINKHTKSSNL